VKSPGSVSYDLAMKIDLKSPGRVGTGIVQIVFWVVMAAIFLPHARQAQSPVLYLIIVGGLLVGLPLAMVIGFLTGQLPLRGERKHRR
jgi:hypothetical protein